jgi:hypothetical protein
MPHVEIVGPGRVRDLAAHLKNFEVKQLPFVAKIQDTYLSADGARLLLDALLVEGYLRQSFFLLVKDEEGGVLIRCHPSSAVQKTEGVKTLIAMLGSQCLELCPGSRVGHTNLQGWLERLGVAAD